MVSDTNFTYRNGILLVLAFCSQILLASSGAEAATLSAADLERLASFERHEGLRGVPDWARAKKEGEVQPAYAEVRKDFGGRGPEIAERFLKHTDLPPRNDAYFFVMEAVADVETAVTLIRALADPPKVESGPVIKVGNRSWIMERDPGEILVAIEATLVNERVGSDPRVVSALVETVAALRAKPKGIGLGTAGAAVSLLGKCRGPEAIQALQRFAADAEPSIRALAVQALGGMAASGEPEKAIKASTVATLARTLRSDPDHRARLEAATSLGKLDPPEGIQPLRDALAQEKHPEVVDAIVVALQKLRAPITEPEACRDIAGRCWGVQAAAPLFACWRSSATREAILAAATTGPPMLRALALHALVEAALVRRTRSPMPLIRAPSPPPPPPGLGGPQGRRSISNLPIPVEQELPPPIVPFDDATRDRLLVASVELLSKEVTAFPDKRDAVSYSTAQVARDAFWEISGRYMPVALWYADRIRPVYSRYASSGRYAASSDLSRKDQAGYIAYRRPRQALAAVLLALPCFLLLIPEKTRRAGGLLSVAILGWGIWSLFMTGVRELPPPPLFFFTLSFSAFLAAGVATAGAGILPWERIRWGPLRGVSRVGLSAVGAGGLAFLACGWSRWNSLFPIGGEGWELIFDPLGSAIVAVVVAAVLSFLDILVTRIRLMFRGSVRG
ncbi:MAG: HEAT repeat domain-containing protein [candidate division NC10 bacterium]|nr:HEAT repeat domain-containing protein [candidate division NC10 bacterium]